MFIFPSPCWFFSLKWPSPNFNFNFLPSLFPFFEWIWKKRRYEFRSTLIRLKSKAFGSCKFVNRFSWMAEVHTKTIFEPTNYDILTGVLFCIHNEQCHWYLLDERFAFIWFGIGTIIYTFTLTLVVAQFSILTLSLSPTSSISLSLFSLAIYVLQYKWSGRRLSRCEFYENGYFPLRISSVQHILDG